MQILLFYSFRIETRVRILILMKGAYIYVMGYVLTLQQKDSETIQVQQLLEKIDDYENQIEDYKSELDKVNKVRNIDIFMVVQQQHVYFLITNIVTVMCEWDCGCVVLHIYRWVINQVILNSKDCLLHKILCCQSDL